ncbi:MAG: pseudaminic acid cytidylyltransferase [Betaproteobacteria bacterium]
MKLAVIPARGGSKRIPRKNIRPFAGLPIIGHSIRAALASALFDEVMVSTDDDEIAEVALSLGAAVPFVRPRTLADDHTGTNAVVRHALEWYRQAGRSALYACCIYATAPFVQPRFLHEGFRLLAESGRDFAFSVTSFGFPVQRALTLSADGSVASMHPEHAATRSQDLPHAFHDAGQFYWGRAQAFLDEVPLFSAASMAVVLPRHMVQDIDTPEDWTRAEFMYQALKSAGEIDS